MLVGYEGADTIQGYAGNDRLYGRGGDDILDGGAGNDKLFGGSDSYWSGSGASNGNDTYVFDRGYGEDVVVDFDGTAGNLDTIRLGDGLAPADVKLHRRLSWPRTRRAA